MSRFLCIEKKFGDFPALELTDSMKGESFELALRGATPLKYVINHNNERIDILDGFASPEEFVYSRGARCWIMAPFANRIRNGVYNFRGNEYRLAPIPPRDYVIHGFTAFENFSVDKIEETEEFVSVKLITKKTRPGVFEGYPFSLDVSVTFNFGGNRLSIKVEGTNCGEIPLPFGTGWHPYFRTGGKGIEHLVLTLNANKIILLDENYFPLPGGAAYGSIEDNQDKNFNSSIEENKRIVDGRVLDTCYYGLIPDNDGLYRASIFDPDNGLKISMFQEGGVTLAFSGNSLSSRKRSSVALEPMQFITNAFNRDELSEKISVAPGETSSFKFGVEISK
jgi:aldose 1-epimerase